MKKFLSKITSFYIGKYDVQSIEANASRGYLVNNDNLIIDHEERIKYVKVYDTKTFAHTLFFQKFFINTPNYIISFKIDDRYKFSYFLEEREIDPESPLVWIYTNEIPCTIHFQKQDRDLISLNEFNPMDLILSGIHFANSFTRLKIYLRNDITYGTLPEKDILIQRVEDNNIYIPSYDNLGKYNQYKNSTILNTDSKIYTLLHKDEFRALKLGDDIKIDVTCIKREKDNGLSL